MEETAGMIPFRFLPCRAALYGVLYAAATFTRHYKTISRKGKTLVLTFKQFLQELNDYLDAKVEMELKLRIDSHISECQECFGVVHTTRMTIRLYKGVEPQPLPEEVKTRMMKALEKKMAQRKQAFGSTWVAGSPA
jgi:hypothetical protein